MKSIIWLCFMVGILTIMPLSYSWECEYGEVKGWIKFYGNEEWKDAPVKDAKLKIHEPFEIKLIVKTETNCDVDIFLYEPGITNAYEIIDGPSYIDEHITLYDCKKGWEKTYIWKIRPTSNWSGGYAPLNFNVWFMKGLENYKNIEKTLIYAYISSQEWKGDEGNGESESHGGIPGFELSLLILAFVVVWKHKRK